MIFSFISREEFLGEPPKRKDSVQQSKVEAAFKVFDKNQDGYVTKEEMLNMSKKITKEQVSMGFCKWEIFLHNHSFSGGGSFRQERLQSRWKTHLQRVWRIHGPQQTWTPQMSNLQQTIMVVFTWRDPFSNMNIWERFATVKDYSNDLKYPHNQRTYRVTVVFVYCNILWKTFSFWSTFELSSLKWVFASMFINYYKCNLLPLSQKYIF